MHLLDRDEEVRTPDEYAKYGTEFADAFENRLLKKETAKTAKLTSIKGKK